MNSILQRDESAANSAGKGRYGRRLQCKKEQTLLEASVEAVTMNLEQKAWL